ncbi:hypothetical protein E3N88_38986 [Mikania micrantha]|uniref:Methyltransferase type 11 domain-containing protein n=1 Tax=Mikania micrantha TaxID=192012 RepID=A0A5N6LVH6_9ASTR|nr:hypothetical protein E3N88_38986 [Mikania micrantha]
MANLFLKQAKQYSDARPGYPQQLFDFLASKTPCHDAVWDVGTGSGQAVTPLASIYKRVIGTDTSKKQLEFAPDLPNVRYELTSSKITMSELKEKIGTESSLDLVTAAQALHWFDHDTFYNQVKWILKKPNGVIAAWCYTIPEIDEEFDPVFRKFYSESKPYWDSLRGLVDDNFTNAWKGDDNGLKSVTYPVYLRIGKSGGCMGWVGHGDGSGWIWGNTGKGNKSVEKGEKLSVPGSPVAGSSGTTRILS